MTDPPAQPAPAVSRLGLGAKEARPGGLRGGLLVVLLFWLLVYMKVAAAPWSMALLRGQHVDQYNLLADGILEGHLYMKEQLPPGFLDLVDPYSPATNGKFRNSYGIWDQSYFQQHFYLYFGCAPAFTLYVPYRILTGGLRIPNQLAVLIFGFGALCFGALLLELLWRRYFEKRPAWMLHSGVFLLGGINLVMYLISQSAMYQVAISCGMFYLAGGLYFAVKSLENRSAVPLALAGAFLALAVGGRPHFVLTSVFIVASLGWILFRRGERRVGRFAALFAPFATGGALLALYNYARFGSILEFGARFQLSYIDMRQMNIFGLRRVPSTAYFMFLQPPTINSIYPYIHPMPALPSWIDRPEGFLLERVTGILCGVPFLWILLGSLALAVMNRRAPAARDARFPGTEGLWLAVGSLLNVSVLVMTPATMRYLADFLGILGILAIVSWFYLDARLSTEPRLQRVARWTAVGLLLVSVVFGIAFSLPPPYHYMDG